MIGYAGSFLVMEESSEKTEKTEKSEEALYSLYHSKNYSKSLVKGEKSPANRGASFYSLSTYKLKYYYLPQDFNINFIYHTSYLDSPSCS